MCLVAAKKEALGKIVGNGEPMAANQTDLDLKEFFTFILNPRQTLASLLQDYYNYHGILNSGHQKVMFEKVVSLLGKDRPEFDALQQSDVIGSYSEILPKFVLNASPELDIPYFSPAPLNAFEKIRVIEESLNEWQSEQLPPPYNMRMRTIKRPALDIFRVGGGQLFVSTSGHQYFNKQDDIFWPEASSRAFGKGVLKYPEIELTNSIVVIQDQFDATNFSHFLYDYLPRIIYFCEASITDLRFAIFFIGGNKTEYHLLLLSLLCDRYNIKLDQFVFDVDRQVWTTTGSVHFFSDQRMTIMHPLNICHPTTLRILHSALSKIPIAFDSGQKLFISRRDATMRTVRNEEALMARLRAEGFTEIVMSDLGPLSQISALANARSVVASHGMGLTNIFFNTRTAKVLEIFNPDIGSDAYALVCRSGGIDYKFLIGQDCKKDNLSFEVDVDLVLDNLIK